MVRAWFMDDFDEDQRLEHQKNPPEFLDIESLKKKTGVLYWKLDPELYEENGSLDEIRNDRGYSYKDQLEISEDKLPNYHEKLKVFFTEHLHTDEEIRFVLKGSGYFDVRDEGEKWIRIEMVPGDLIVLPAGIYHRFTLDKDNYIKVIRLFIGEPVWTPHNRPCEEMDCRKLYLKQMESGF